ncbi:hypothetical protein ACFYYS_00450 [Streptomyces sp. NPDC002120]|uniref:hypothetical protein n=1 Tax=Streptomyces sp. NPDC002120 TaxID=3364631 RepID=UPI0036AB5BC7
MFGSKTRTIESLRSQLTQQAKTVALLENANANNWALIKELEEELEIAALEYVDLERRFPERDERGRFRRKRPLT